MKKKKTAKHKVAPRPWMCLLVTGALAVIVFVGVGIKKAVDFGLKQYYAVKYPLQYENLILKYAKENHLEPAFVAAVINAESSFQPKAISNANAYGLMQIQPDTFDWAKARNHETRSLTKDDLLLPEINIEYGCVIYRLLLDEFGSLDNAVVAYHAGWGSLKQWLSNEKYSSDGENLDVIPFGDTNRYLQSIHHNLEVYRRRYPKLAQISREDSSVNGK